jgi:Bacterial SH3 domain
MPRRRAFRRAITGLLVALTSGAAVLLPATPAAADTFGGHATATVRIRSGPGTNYSIIGSLPSGTQVHVYCVRSGEVINGTQWWDYIGGGGYVTDAYVFTGYDTPIAQYCGGGSSWANVSDTGGCTQSGSGSATNTLEHHTAISGQDHWYPQDSFACDGPYTRYFFTIGNGPTPSGDFLRWGYFPGAYGHCDLSLSLPRNAGYTFTTSAHYQIVTGADRNGVLMDDWYNQAALAGGVINFGTRYADGSGFLGLKLLDSSPTAGVRVVGGNLHFSNCYATA